jgi:hypothetical protein
MPLMAAIASPKGEQAKTDIDRLKKSIQMLRERWQIEDRENNAATIRAYQNDVLVCEMFRFSLATGTDNESKTLNVLVIEESHKADHEKRRDQLDPMLASTGGPTWHLGVGCTINNDYKRGCDGHLPGIAIIVDADEVCRDRREVYEQTGDPQHLAYERKLQEDIRKYGRQNPEIRRNFYLEDTVEQGNFVSRDRLLSCARGTVVVPTDKLFVGVDWARSSDHTWLTVVNDENDVLAWFKYPHGLYQDQIELMRADLTGAGYLDGRILGVRADDTGVGGPTEMLMNAGFLSMGTDAFFKFTVQSKDQLYTNFQEALFREPGTLDRFSYPADHPLTAEFEEQMILLVKEFKGDGEYLSVHHPDVASGRDDAPDATALALLAGSVGGIGELLFI